MRTKTFISCTLVFSVASACAQNVVFERFNAPVFQNGRELPMPFAGGLNAPQFSPADLNQDGIEDLVVFDRVGDVLLTFLNKGTAGKSDYVFAPEYACNFPKLIDYALLRDYNKDGAADIFCASLQAGSQEVQVFRGYFEDKRLRFKPFRFSYPNCPSCDPRYIWYPDNDQPGFWNNLPVSRADLPAFDDIDNDGDLDILTFASSVGGHIWYLRNTSKESGFGSDSLKFRLDDDCWGRFYESGFLPCKNDLSPKADACSNRFDSDAVEDRDGLHPGSTVMTYDEDGDGDREVVLGDISFVCLNKMRNGGTKTAAWMTTQDTLFPSNTTPVGIVIFPAAFYLDLNNDGKKDMVAAPNNQSIGDDQKGVWYYQNTGSVNKVEFSLNTKTFLVGDMIDLGTAAHPAFVDVNADGLLDLVVGNSGYFAPQKTNNASLYLFLNTGTPTQPRFTLDDADWLGLSEFTPNDYDFAPTFGDMDVDGDLDLLVGSNIGSFYFYENTAGPGNPMKFTRDLNPLWITMDVGLASVPVIYDLDGDGVQDVIAGERSGNINYFRNTGSSQQPKFGSQPTIEKLGAINTTIIEVESVGFSAPVLVEEQNGEAPLLITGTNSGHLEVYSGLAPVSTPFTKADKSYGNVDEGGRSHPAFADLNGDGLLEMAVGNLRGGLALYSTKLKSCSTSTTVETPGQLPVSLQPNPARNWVKLQLEAGAPVRWRAFNALGQMTSAAESADPTFYIDVSAWQEGVYFLDIEADNRRAVAKIVVK
jgi:FG-GAP-like repeat/Secretion system C-terminal sorting domain